MSLKLICASAAMFLFSSVVVADEVPKGTIAFFNHAKTCPTNWSEAQYTYGRLLLGSREGASPPTMFGTPMQSATPPMHAHSITAAADIDYKNTATVNGSDKGVGKKGVYQANPVDGKSPLSQLSQTDFPFVQFLTCEFTAETSNDAFPISTVSYFNRQQCPDGWIDDPNYDGRFLLPIMPKGQVGFVTADAWLEPEKLSHSHDLNSSIDMGNVGFVWGGGAHPEIAEPGLQPVKGQLLRQMDTDEPLIPYVSLLACRKQARPTGTLMPTGMSIFYSGQNCPSNWQPVPGSAGRFPVGVAPSGSLGAGFGGNPMGPGEITRSHAHSFSLGFTVPNENTNLTQTWANLWLGKHGTFTASGTSVVASLTLPYFVVSHCERVP